MGIRNNRILEETAAITDFFWIRKFALPDGDYSFGDILNCRLLNIHFCEFGGNGSIVRMQKMVFFCQSESNVCDDIFPLGFLFKNRFAISKSACINIERFYL